MAGLSLSGVASGIDTASIVQQLMAIERQSSTRLKLRESAIQGREAGLKDVQAKLTALKTAANALKAPTLYGLVQDVASTDATKVTGTRTASVTPGTYDVTVQSLSVREQWTHSFSPNAQSGTITLSQAGQSDVVVNLAANATLSDAVAAINAQSAAFATAAAVAGKLVLTSKNGGAAGSFTVASDAGGSALLSGGTERAGADAQFTVNGVAKTSATNVATAAVPGLSIALKAPVATAVTLTVGEEKQDATKITAAFKGFVDAYNAVITTVQSKISEKRVENASTSSDAAKGQLFGDSALSGILSALRKEVSDIVAGNPGAMDQLSEIGITVPKTTGGASSADARLGKLVLDEGKLAAALEADALGVQRLMGGLTGTSGFADKITKLVDRHAETWTESGVTYKGTLVSRLEGATRETDALKDQMARLDLRLEAKEKRMKAQFAAMEKALGLAQTQQSWLSGQIAGLRGASS